MKNLTIETLTLASRGSLYIGDSSLLTEELGQKEAAAVVLDSRLLVPQAVFIATRGERVDGHRFIPEVFEKGALAVICEELPEKLTGPCILVEDSLQALKDVASFYRSQLEVKVIGITGSVGKTSTKECIAGVLSARYRLWKTQGNFNNEVGLPLTILQIREEHELAVLEMGISQFGEMHRLSEMARPDICVITNIGQCHLESLGDRDGVLKAKSEILDFWNPDGLVCINGDDDKLITLKERLGEKLVTFGRNPANDYHTRRETSMGLLGSRIHIGGRIEADEVVIPLPGEHMVLNALAAAAVADALELSVEEIRKGMQMVEAVKGRSHILSLKDWVVIDDCYNANPVSMKAALDLLQEASGRRVAILGDMFELGEEEEKLHGEIGAYAAEGRVDLLFCVGKLSHAMYQSALNTCAEETEATKTFTKEQVYYVENKEELHPLLEKTLSSGDTILLKASHGMHFEEIVEWMKESCL
ncbi:MAG: UDP-N-acetylmuramoyl-tripeptide--D-alanyl-D-alanine ligase [Lachnospiraceae bacterium]|nr:UDP-N-acetylmuramoyl-tripeptide--D-alanyl-D-alanine ligase [Lachnospiraceae bacterium]